MRSIAPARRYTAPTSRERELREDEETAETVQPAAALLRMARREQYDDDEVTVMAYVDASDDGVLVPCIHASPAPGTMPVLPRELVDEVERHARQVLTQAWTAANQPAFYPQQGYHVSSGMVPAAAWHQTPASGAHAVMPSHAGVSSAWRAAYEQPSHVGMTNAGVSGMTGVTSVTGSGVRPAVRRSEGDFVRNLAAVCIGLVGALAIGTGAIVLHARHRPETPVAPAAVTAPGTVQMVPVRMHPQAPVQAPAVAVTSPVPAPGTTAAPSFDRQAYAPPAGRAVAPAPGGVGYGPSGHAVAPGAAYAAPPVTDPRDVHRVERAPAPPRPSAPPPATGEADERSLALEALRAAGEHPTL